MRALLNTVLERMHSEKVPFTFLMPAAEAIYRPYDFRYIYDQCMQEVKKDETADVSFDGDRIVHMKVGDKILVRKAGTQKRWQIFLRNIFRIRGKYMLSEIQPIIRR